MLKKIFNTYSGLPKEIYILFIARIINCLGSFVFPLMTLFLTERLGLTTKETGTFLSIMAISYVPGALVGGKLSDVIGRKRIMIFGQGLAALCFIPCAFLGNSMIIPWLLILSGFLSGAVQPANSAMVADLTNKENRKTAYSLIYLGINIGVAVGPIIAGFLYRNHIKWVFLGTTIASLVAITLVGVYIKETIPSKDEINQKEISEDEKAQEGNVFKILIQRPRLLAFALLSMAYSFAYSQCNFSITLQLKDLFGDNASKLIGGVNSTNAVVVIIFTTFIVYKTRKNKTIFNISLAGIFFAVGFGMYYFVHSYLFFLVATVIWTIGEILNATNSGVYIAEHAPITHRGRFNSILSIITGSGAAVGPFIMGKYIQSYSVKAVWPLIFSITIVAALLMLLLIDKKNETHNANV